MVGDGREEDFASGVESLRAYRTVPRFVSNDEQRAALETLVTNSLAPFYPADGETKEWIQEAQKFINGVNSGRA